MGLILADQGVQDKARAALRKAAEFYDKALAGVPGDLALLDGQSEVWHRLGDLDYRTDKPTANTAYRKAVAIRERLAREHPREPRFRMALSRSLNGVGLSVDSVAEEVARVPPIARAAIEARRGNSRGCGFAAWAGRVDA